MNFKFQILKLLCALALALNAISAHAAIRYVNALATGANNGTSWPNSYTDLQSALAAAQSGDEIWVAAGTYKPTTGTNRTVSFVMKDGVGIYGGFAGTETALSQRTLTNTTTTLSGDLGASADTSDNTHHVIIGANYAVLDGFTIKNGNADSSAGLNTQGGGMINDGVSPIIANCTFSRNTVSGKFPYGGGMYNTGSSPTVTNCTFRVNAGRGRSSR
jgi:hypothetical protein